MLKGSLLYKVLLIVIVPLTFEVGIFSVLLGIQNAQQVEAQRIDKLRLISASVNKITGQILQMQTSFENFENPALAARAVNQSFLGLFKSLDELSALTETDAKKHQIVVKSVVELQQTKADLDELKRAVMADNVDDVKAIGRTFRPRFHAHLHHIIDSGFLQLSSDTAAELNTDAAAQIRANETTLLKLALMASLVLALLSAAGLSKYLIGKLKIIAQNAARMSRREQLLPPVGGNDEISLVDLSMHAAAKEIRQLERAKEEIMGMVSHDIRNPLSSIKFAAEALKSATAEETDYYYKNIDSNCDRILTISQNLLDIQKLESGMLIANKTRTAIKECIEAAAEAVEGSRQSRNISIEITAPKELSAQLDGPKIEQVLSNLIGNAIKFSPQNTTVKVIASGHLNGILVSVEDSGKGIAEQYLKTIFDRFVQSSEDNHRAKGSVGLGLAICKGLVEMHFGWIKVENIEPRGCRFSFWLPTK